MSSHDEEGGRKGWRKGSRRGWKNGMGEEDGRGGRSRPEPIEYGLVRQQGRQSPFCTNVWGHPGFIPALVDVLRAKELPTIDTIGERLLLIRGGMGLKTIYSILE